MVLDVGASPSGHASAGTLASRCTAANPAIDDRGRPVIAIIATPWRLSAGTIARISSDSPEFDSASTTSSSVTMPRSPWLASPGCMKNDGVPVDASVAEILRATCPDLPIPVQTTRPRQASISRQAAANSGPRRAPSACSACVSISTTARPLATRAASSIVGEAWEDDMAGRPFRGPSGPNSL